MQVCGRCLATAAICALTSSDQVRCTKLLTSTTGRLPNGCSAPRMSAADQVPFVPRPITTVRAQTLLDVGGDQRREIPPLAADLGVDVDVRKRGEQVGRGAEHDRVADRGDRAGRSRRLRWGGLGGRGRLRCRPSCRRSRRSSAQPRSSGTAAGLRHRGGLRRRRSSSGPPWSGAALAVFGAAVGFDAGGIPGAVLDGALGSTGPRSPAAAGRCLVAEARTARPPRRPTDRPGRCAPAPRPARSPRRRPAR